MADIFTRLILHLIFANLILPGLVFDLIFSNRILMTRIVANCIIVGCLGMLNVFGTLGFGVFFIAAHPLVPRIPSRRPCGGYTAPSWPTYTLLSSCAYAACAGSGCSPGVCSWAALIASARFTGAAKFRRTFSVRL